MANCSGLEILSDFNTYISLVRSETRFNETILTECRQQVCVAIYGEGNPDIGGIGVVIGYCLEVALGFGLPASILIFGAKKSQRSTGKLRFLERVLHEVFDSFFDCAIYFALAVELASLVMLIKKDYGLSTRGFGANDAQISVAISIICILPLLYPVAVGSERPGRAGDKERQAEHPTPEDARHQQTIRLSLFYLLATLFLYPFVSQSIHNFGPSEIGNGAGPEGTTVVTDSEWDEITRLCFDSVPQLSTTEFLILAILELLGGLFVYLCMFSFLIRRPIHTTDAGDKRESRLSTDRYVQDIKEYLDALLKGSTFSIGVLMLVPLALAIPLL